ncbi:MAG: biotin--[acetyl-CoA-carboxylase] ligase [Flavobacteriaceae bacterium]|nr:biotin--[acetyl-CoA-carboxylase] ligase [Flavobacteriaceae bacterium]
MQIIKLDAIDSTNRYLRDLVSEIPLEDFAVVAAKYQTHGRGQRATTWQSEKGKNLIISVLKKDISINIEHQFLLSIAVSLAVYKTLEAFQIPNLSIKWPNDILSRQNKIGGILIELVTKKNKIDHAIIGIGLNVNQIEFDQLPKASSLKKITGIHYNPDELLCKLLENLKHFFNNANPSQLWKIYEQFLFRKNKPSTFVDAQDVSFSGIIQGVSKQGKLRVKTENSVEEFDLKSIQLLY